MVLDFLTDSSLKKRQKRVSINRLISINIFKKRISKAAILANVQFVRIFGSATEKSQKNARDVDLVVGPPPFSLGQISKLQSDFELVFKKPVDLIQLKSGLSPQLLLEIARTSKPLWEAKKSGRACYIEWIDRLLAIAQDEIMGLPNELRKQFVSKIQRTLRVS